MSPNSGAEDYAMAISAPAESPVIVPLRAVDEPGPSRPEVFPPLRVLLSLREPFLIPFILLLVTRAYFWRLLPFATEDAYITFRYARNLVVGFGLTFNPGERVMGFSSPLWTLWNALGFKLMGDPVVWSRSWSLIADVVTLLVLGNLLRRHASRASSWCFTAFFALWTYYAAVAVSGMEISIALALIVLSAALVEVKSPASGICLAALALVRPEGLVAAGLIALGARGRDRLLAFLLTAATLTALWGYYGTPVPQSLIAKSSVYGTPGLIAGRHWWEWISPFAFGRWPATSEGSILFAMAVVTAPAAVLGAMTLWRARKTALFAAVGAMIVVWIGYCVVGVAYFFWYLAIPLTGLMALAAVGLPRMSRGRALYASLLVFILGTWTVAPNLYGARANAEWQSFGGAAEYLATHARPGQKVMLEPIGMVGWRCKLWVIDQVGLVSPAVSRRRLQGAGWMADVIGAERPDWLVLRKSELSSAEAFAGAGALFRRTSERDSVLARYSLATLVHPAAGDQALAVLARLP